MKLVFVREAWHGPIFLQGNALMATTVKKTGIMEEASKVQNFL